MPFPTTDFRKTLISSCAELDEELYLRIFTGAGVAEDNELARLGQRMEEADDEDTKYWLSEQAADLNFYKSQLSQWAGYLSMIAIYSKIEISRARMMMFATGAKKDYHRKEDVTKALLESPFHLVHEDTSEYDKVDELRVVNNNIKHYGPKIGSVLAKIPGYAEGGTLNIDFDKWHYFFTSGQAYLKDFSAKIISRLPPLASGTSK